MVNQNQVRTLLCVHAHPDDESISTGGVLARYHAQGFRTVLVTCTNGECGDGPGGHKPGDPSHDPEEVVAIRHSELMASASELAISHVVELGYRDSGMMGWPTNDARDAFWQLDVEAGAARLAGVFEEYQPQVVVTYDEKGFYGHPDHIQANRITRRAIELTKIPSKLYYTAVPLTVWGRLEEAMADAGLAPPEEIEDLPPLGTPDAEISAWIDVSEHASAKYRSLAAHASQAENMFFLKMGEETFRDLFPFETFIRVMDTTGAAVPEDDLFVGIDQGSPWSGPAMGALDTMQS